MGLQHIQPVPFSLSLYLCYRSRPVSSPMCISGLSWTKVSALHRAVPRPKSQLWLWPLHPACRREVLDGAPTSPFPTSQLSHYRTSAEVGASASVSALEVKLLFYRRPLWRVSHHCEYKLSLHIANGRARAQWSVRMSQAYCAKCCGNNAARVSCDPLARKAWFPNFFFWSQSTCLTTRLSVNTQTAILYATHLWSWHGLNLS